jgi:hypothetical protein
VTAPAELSKTCTKCGRTGTRSFVAEGGAWVCAAKWACQGREIEARLRGVEPVKAVCHKCGRVGVRGFVHDVASNAPKCQSWSACVDRVREREARFKEYAEDLNSPAGVQVDLNGSEPITEAERAAAGMLALDTELDPSIGVEGFNALARRVVAAVRPLIEADALNALADGAAAYGPPSADQIRGIAFMVRQGRKPVRDWLADDESHRATTSEES